MKSPSVFSAAAAVTFAAGIALAGTGLRPPAEGRPRKAPGSPGTSALVPSRKVRPPADPTRVNPALARALTAGRTG